MVKGVPVWKIRREIDRAIQKLKRPLSRLYDPFMQRRYDLNWKNKILVHSGDLQVSEKVALFLIFQPNNLRASTLETCAHLIKSGYAPLVVSNSPLSTFDIAVLKQVCWKIVIRPNIGYDFGGYRDGLRFLQSIAVNPSRILILNDSIWFPTFADETLIAQMEATSADLVGALYQEGDKTRSVKSARYSGFIESFFYLINDSCLQNSHFKSFWEHYRLSNLKYNAVYDGERHFSLQMQKAGLTVSSVISRSRFLDEIALQKPAFIMQVLQYSAYTNSDLSNMCETLLKEYDASPAWKDTALDYIKKVSAKHHFHSSFYVATMLLLGASFLKKGSGTVLAKGYGLLHHEMRTQFLKAVADGVLPPPPKAISAEIEHLQRTVTTNALPPRAVM